MATLTTVHNPFDPIGSREVKEIESGKPIYASVAGFHCYFDVVVSVNGHITHDYEYVIQPEDHVGFLAVPGKGGGKNPLATIAMVALAIAAPGIGTAVAMHGAFALGSMGIGLSAFGASMMIGIATAGVMMAGGMLINSLLGPSMPSTSPVQNMQSSPTYGWDNVQNQSAEGVPLPIVYGKTKIIPPIISQYVETVNNKQYLNILYALCDGEIASVSDIMINNNPIGYYSNVTSEIRTGTNTQTLIPSFDNTRVDTSVGAKLSTSETIRLTSYNNVTGLSIVVSAPSGIYYANDSGGLDTRTVGLEIKCRKVGDVVWMGTSSSISGNATSTLRKTFTFDSLPAGQYEISVRRTSDESTSTRTNDKVYFEAFTEIIYDDFIYPNTALLAIRALATDQLSGSMPTVSCVVDRGGNTSNPSIAAQNMIALLGAEVDQAAFDAWTAYCTAEGFECNIVFDSETTARDALNIIGMLGRANIVQIGAKYIPIIEKAETLPVQRFLFTMGNIIRDSFNETYLPLADRSNVIEVTYFDETLSYEKMSIELYQHMFDDSNDTTRKTSVTLYGCTDRAQAIRHGRFMLNKNRYLTNTVSFEADVDAIACTIGDVIDVAHDVPQWGFSGRIDSIIIDSAAWCYSNATTVDGIQADETNTQLLKLDRTLTLDAAIAYGLAIRLHDDTIISVSITPSVSVETDIIPVPSGYAVGRFDLYSFGETGRVTKQFRVLSITRSSDQRRKISAIEYIPEVYNDTIDMIDVQNFSSLEAVSYLQMTTDTEVSSDGRSINIINLLWKGQAISWDVYMKELSTDADWQLIGNTKNHWMQIKDVKAGYYGFKVGDKQASSTITIARVPLADVQNFVSFYQNNQLVLKWDAVVEQYRTPIWYEVRRGPSWSNSEILGLVTTNSIIVDISGFYWVKAYYKSLDGVEVYSENPTGIDIGSATILRNVVASYDEAATSWSGTLSGLTTDTQTITLPAGTQYGYYDIPVSHIISLSSPQLCRISMRYSAAGGDTSTAWDDVTVFDEWESVDGYMAGSFWAKAKIAISQDGTTWGDWQDYIMGDYVGMAFKFRLELHSANTTTTVIASAFAFTVDMPDRVEKGTGLSVPSGGKTITYSYPFQIIPSTQITIVNAQEGDQIKLTSESESSCHVEITNSGSSVARTINHLSQGY